MLANVSARVLLAAVTMQQHRCCSVLYVIGDLRWNAPACRTPPPGGGGGCKEFGKPFSDPTQQEQLIIFVGRKATQRI